MINLSATVTGAAITGLTSPTYGVTVDSSPVGNVNKSWVVTSLGGTQTGVTLHSISDPFTFSVRMPAALATVGVVDATGVYRAASRKNIYEFLTRKGMPPITGQAPQVGIGRHRYEIPAGSETASAIQLAAMLSFDIGVLTDIRNGLLDTLKTGVA